MDRIGILGGGNIGQALAVMLRAIGLTVTIADQKEKDGCVVVDASNDEQLCEFILEQDAIVSALPFYLNMRVAAICAEAGRSYFDFTEDTKTTAFIQELAENHPEHTFAPQCGLAPGLINIIAADLISQVDEVDTLELRVGALPLTTSNQMAYYRSWSSDGLINEYLHPCDSLYQGQPTKLMPLDGLETVVLDGVTYEAFNTSGGVATMCQSYAGKIKTLNYKTLRYQGHRDHMHFVLHDLGFADHPELLVSVFNQSVPVTEQDVVIIYVNLVGRKDGLPVRKSFLRKVFHTETMTAIQLTTAAGMASVIELWTKKKLPAGFVRQESITLSDVLQTEWGQAVIG
jgi:saccharopine dehydrogenase-like NADP-dependent oxidoreductase